jgi:hypothetical protein
MYRTFVRRCSHFRSSPTSPRPPGRTRAEGAVRGTLDVGGKSYALKYAVAFP